MSEQPAGEKTFAPTEKRLTDAAKKGDVLIWHAQLYHRGARIRDALNRTRRSLVAHYFSTIDFPSDGAHVRRHDAGGLYYARPRLDLRRQ